MNDLILTMSTVVEHYPNAAKNLVAIIWLSVGMTAMRLIKDSSSSYMKFLAYFVSSRNFASSIISLSVYRVAYNNLPFMQNMGISMSALLFGTFAEFIIKLMSEDKVKLQIVNAIIKLLSNSVNIKEEDLDNKDDKKGD